MNSKVMETTGLPELLSRMAGEYAAAGSIYGIPKEAFEEAFRLEASSPGLSVMGKTVSLPVGPAAGPHTQIAPNLVASYLAGSRVFELKTVQQNDALEIGKPCILALDEGHNTEWSTELTLDQARQEYLRGWIAVNLLAAVFSAKPDQFVFNMSVGYTLEGIKGPKMDAFIEGLRAPARAVPGEWKALIAELSAFVESPAFVAAFGAEALAKARALAAAFPASPVHSVTLSTMHGCPPAEIERIGRYLIEAKGFDTFVKLNPTLLGYDEARAILDEAGWTEVVLTRDNFEHDLQWKDALALVGNLRACADAAGRKFGVKLSNTLANVNDEAFLPGGERYMSGRALYPLTVRLAARLAEAFPDFPRRFSYCGGVSAFNAKDLIEAGAGPLTVATDILKPGGYLRLIPVARAAVEALTRADAASDGRPAAAKLKALAAAAPKTPEFRGDWKAGTASIAKPLPAFDCFAAPCSQACPVHQKAPHYIKQGAQGQLKEAMETILADNSLPFTTGVLCDHVCQAACARVDYEGPVRIRDSKLVVARAAAAAGLAFADKPAPAAAALKAAVVGAGPAGLACAHRLALAGVPVTVFDAAPGPGGVPANVIPRFRIARSELKADVDRIAALGAVFRFDTKVSSLAELKAQGFTAFFVAPGAAVPRELPLSGSGVKVVDALEFLEAVSAAEGAGKPSPYAGAKRVVVAGGGNTAMDAVRVAARLPGVASVSLSYRRTRSEMPADREEFELAVREASSLAGAGKAGVLLDLTLPEAAAPGKLALRRMKLGAKDASGRRAPLPSDETLSLDCDLLIAAVGESPDAAFLKSLGFSIKADGRPEADAATMAGPVPGLYVGGDARRGPASIIAAEADGRDAALAMMAAAGLPPPPKPDKDKKRKTLNRAKLARRGEMLPSLDPADPAFLEREAERCLNCGSACLRCAEVCPNRANFAVPVDAKQGGFADSPFRQLLQILHVDYLCNECGNCGLFCPYQGEPFRHKPTLFRSAAALESSKNAGFAFLGDGPAPELRYRGAYAGPARTVPYALWSAGAAGDDGVFFALAAAVRGKHAYLYGGSK